MPKKRASSKSWVVVEREEGRLLLQRICPPLSESHLARHSIGKESFVAISIYLVNVCSSGWRSV